MEKIRVRFAPSPTGFLHVGNARTALFNWLFARKNGGVFILRVEDTDAERSKEEYEKKLMEDLSWLGLDWDEGPNIGGAFGPYYQSQRIDIYKDFTNKLLEAGKAYYCFCSPEELQREREKSITSGGTPIYSGRCRSFSLDESQAKIEAGEEAAVRLKIEKSGTINFPDVVRGSLSFERNIIGDSVLVRSNGFPAYNYAVVIDDHLMEVTHVIRGEDHISNTPRQLLVYEALSIKPPRFAHLPMVMGKDNSRLSKRHGATAVNQFEKEGYLPAALFNYLALLGWAPPEGKEVLSKDEIVRFFNLKKVSRSAAIFDYDKLKWINHQQMVRLPSSEIAKRAYPYLEEKKLLPREMKMTECHWKWLERAVKSLVERVDRFSEFPKEFLNLFEFSPDDLAEETKSILRSESALQVIKVFGEKMSKIEEFDFDKFASVTTEIKNETGIKGKDLFHPLRITLTAKLSGLDLDKFIPLVEEGAKLELPRPIKNSAERIIEVLNFVK